MDSRSVSLSKALSWRVIAWSITAIVSYGVVRDGQFALLVGTLDSLVKIGAYYGHERAWLTAAEKYFSAPAGEEVEMADHSVRQRRVSFLKALSWRVVAFTITVVVSGIMTRSISAALTVGAIDSLIKIAAYYFHERAWIKIIAGREAAATQQQRAASAEQA